MCTVIVRVPEDPSEAARILAVRDEDPDRPWNPLGEHWPESHPRVSGVQDARAGGAWLATLPEAGRLAVLLNVGGPAPQPGLASRGEVALDAVEGRAPDPNRRTQPYNLVTVAGGKVTLSLSDGESVNTQTLDPGVHMLVNSELPNDESFTRVQRWLPEFRAATPPGSGPDWFQPWLEVMDRSAALPPTDDASIIRDNRPWGIPTQSLLMCTATVSDHAVDVDYTEFERPGEWATRFHIS
ncbi:NRDE family protein [Tessaracoccus sp. OS52]|uniref:NRDE family protein n=1 Tax=Tessaracoccus sp. OS52 TaxID=2886691 RepID=UPI001D11CF06|nr:NRDE family protein [Tessaracoccus sp. OS52]MCC2592404.1 NRDE family protein [Tessaracoccus sp. OS52]